MRAMAEGAGEASAEGIAGEAWDLASEYPSADGADVDADIAEAQALLGEVERRNAALAPLPDFAADAGEAVAAARTIFGLLEAAKRLLDDLGTYADCLLSVDSQDESAQRLQGRLQTLQKRFGVAAEPLEQFQTLAPEAVVEDYLAHPSVEPARFVVRHARRRRHELLPLAQEALVNNLSQDGIHAWGRLYDQLAGTLRCDVSVGGKRRRCGLAQAASMMMEPDDRLREGAWRAVNAAWDEHAESCAAALNAIAGWRLEMCRARSRKERAVSFLDAPLHDNRIAKATLDAVLEVAREGIPLARRAALLQAKAYGKARYGPWDLRAPAPAENGGGDPIPYAEAVSLVADSYGAVDARMGDFVRMMAERRWIEGTSGGGKRPGAYCTGFRKSRTPRVYMTYAGSASDVIVLAHELGHAFHSWVMRDLPDSQRGYGMSIAETASTFGESIVREALLQRAETPAAELAIVWEEAVAATGFLLNIPARFEFERNFYEARAERPLRPAELKATMSDAWRKWYGDCLAEPDPLFWASKLHFYISGLSFYNFPYLFGYLFSLGVCARRQAWGDEFFSRYEALLRDTGRMTAEELAAKHLDVDLQAPDFWRDTLRLLASRVDLFERLVERRLAEQGGAP